MSRRVVGLYGDPGVSWSIMLEVGLEPDRPALESGTLAARAAAVVAAHPHLGRAPVVEPHRGAVTVEQFGNRRFDDHDPLVRIAAADHRLLVAAHHGAVDGLGLVGLAGLLLDLGLDSSARGMARTGHEPGFLRGNLRRVGEALLRPPVRFAASTSPGRGEALAGDWYATREVSDFAGGTTALAWAAVRALRRWNADAGESRRRDQPVLALGVSRRSGAAPLAPHRDTAYSRVRATGVRSSAAMAAALRATAPEPDFPVAEPRRVDPVRIATRMLGNRLGASLLISNLGLLGPPGSGIAEAVFWPAASGPHGVAVGLVSAGPPDAPRTAVTVRMRRTWFDAAAPDRLAGLLADALRR